MEETQFERLNTKVEFLRAALLAEAMRISARIDRDDVSADVIEWMALVGRIVGDCQLSAVVSDDAEPWEPMLDIVGEAFACKEESPHYHFDGLRGPYRTCIEPPTAPLACYQRNGFMVHHTATCQCVRRPSR